MLTSIIKLQVGDTENRSKHLRGLINWKPRGKKTEDRKETHTGCFTFLLPLRQRFAEVNLNGHGTSEIKTSSQLYIISCC